MHKHAIEVRVYYEDTDAGGVVYYANYLKYTERARTEYLRSLGFDVHEHHRAGHFFVVSRVEVKYKRPAVLGDLIEVTCELLEMRAASMTINHRILRGQELLVEAQVTLVHTDSSMRPVRMPEALRQQLTS